MSMSVDSDERVDEPSTAFQRSVRGVLCAVHVLCVLFGVGCAVCCVLCVVCCALCVVCVCCVRCVCVVSVCV